VCASGTAFDIPVYISPIAVVFNLQGVSGKGKTLNMDAETIAKIFDGKITKWNDPAIADQNKDLKLPDTAITVVHRSDKSGTTQNFVSYFKDVTPDNWTYDLSENWPNEVGQGAKGTSGVISTVKQADGTIGYADFSQVGDLGTVAVKVGDKYYEISAEAGSKVIGDSKQDDTVKGDNRIVIKINHATEAEGAYPIVLVSYDIVCPAYKDTKQAEFAKAWLTYVTSDEGQKAAQDAAGTAPLPSSLKSEITKSIEAIKTK
ncbi:extracellular solute-binding protein, partial [Escherichia coli]|nr:extracellular solute-binding protein [Escherichia coli]